MKRLLLLRHAKAMPPGPSDHARALSEKGVRDADEVGRLLMAKGWQPELAIVSDASRTRQTFEHLALGSGTVLRLDGRIYEASPTAIIAAVAETRDEVASVLVVAHNPGIADAARALAATGRDADLTRLRGGFPTATLAVLCFELSSWSGLANTGGLLEALQWTNPSGPED